jgi:hypothetical protein
MTIQLNIFTNCHESSPSTRLVRQTYKSFCETFGPLIPKIWIDPHPKQKAYTKYVKNLQTHFPESEMIETKSFSDGYIKSILQSKADWLFQLEGDWEMQSHLIKHSLKQITEMMEITGIYHLRFNKHANYPTKQFDSTITPHTCKGIDFCTTPFLSNNPHIINRVKYLEFIKKEYLQVQSGSLGIEQVIGRKPDTWGALYGGIDYSACIKHLDGRGRRKHD